MADKITSFYNKAQVERSFAPIDTASSGDNTIVTGVAGSKIVVYSIFLICGADLTIIWKSASTVLLGGAAVAERGGYHIESDFAVTETADGENLIVNLSGASQVGGGITYVVEDA